MVEKKDGVLRAGQEKERLRKMIRAGRSSAQAITRARILLQIDEGWPFDRLRTPAGGRCLGARTDARDERRLLNLQRQLSRLNLLIIDELGFVPLSRTGAELLFEVFSQRYERGSILVSTNLPSEEWTEVFGSERLTGALLDRLTHHVHILEMNGESHRLQRSRESAVSQPLDESEDDEPTLTLPPPASGISPRNSLRNCCTLPWVGHCSSAPVVHLAAAHVIAIDAFAVAQGEG